MEAENRAPGGAVERGADRCDRPATLEPQAQPAEISALELDAPVPARQRAVDQLPPPAAAPQVRARERTVVLQPAPQPPG